MGIRWVLLGGYYIRCNTEISVGSYARCVTELSVGSYARCDTELSVGSYARCDTELSVGLMLGWVFFETKAYPISKGPVHGHGGFWFHNQRNTSMFLTSKAF